MSLTFFTEPFYSLADFDRLFDEAFNARSLGAPSSPAVARSGSNENAAVRPMRPRYVCRLCTVLPSSTFDAHKRPSPLQDGPP